LNLLLALVWNVPIAMENPIPSGKLA